MDKILGSSWTGILEKVPIMREIPEKNQAESRRNKKKHDIEFEEKLPGIISEKKMPEKVLAVISGGIPEGIPEFQKELRYEFHE